MTEDLIAYAFLFVPAVLVVIALYVLWSRSRGGPRR